MKAKVAARAAVLILGGSLALTGCGATKATTAAVVGDRVVTEQEAMDAAQEINARLQLQQPVSPSTIVTFLVRAPFILDQAAKSGMPVTDSAVVAQMPSLAGASPATLKVIRADSALQRLSDTDKAAVAAALAKAKVVVNPRYGSYDPKTLSVALSRPNWISAQSK